MHRPISTRTSTRVIWASGTEQGDQPTPLRQPMALLEDMPVEPTVALLVRPMALRPIVVLPLRSMPVVRPSPLALVGSPMPLLPEHMPHHLPNPMDGYGQINRANFRGITAKGCPPEPGVKAVPPA